MEAKNVFFLQKSYSITFYSIADSRMIEFSQNVFMYKQKSV